MMAKLGGPTSQSTNYRCSRLRNPATGCARIVEPVFGQIKQARGFRQFLTRRIKSVASEWALLCIVHNLLKLAAKLTADRQTAASIA
jgi:hypothetical protein